MAKVYRVRVVRGENSVEAEGDKAFVLEMLRKYSVSEESVTKIGKVTTAGPVTSHKSHISTTSDLPAKGISVGEFIRQMEIKKHTDFVLAFGYYLEKYAGQTNFTPADINEAYYDAKLDTSNTSQMIIQNIKRGYFMAAKAKKGEGGGDGKKRYTLTHSGEAHVNKLISGKTSK